MVNGYISINNSIPAGNDWPIRIFGLNATLLLCHEIDSAYWREWELFGLPGGVQGFVVLHLVLVGLVFWGFQLLIVGDRKGRWFSLLLALGGIGGGILHGGFLLAGSHQFHLPVSIALIAAFLVVSLFQLGLTVSGFREKGG